MPVTRLLDAYHNKMLSGNPPLQDVDYFLAYIDGWKDAAELFPTHERSDILTACTLYRKIWEERRSAYFAGGA